MDLKDTAKDTVTQTAPSDDGIESGLLATDAGARRKRKEADGIESTPGERWKKLAVRISRAFILMVVGHLLFSNLPMPKAEVWVQAAEEAWREGLHWVFLAGFLAQLVDGALGMGYGVACSGMLLSAGLNPATISGSIHTAEMFASGASGISHYRFGNVNKKLFKALLVPGVLGAVAGAFALVQVGERYGAMVRPLMAAYTLLLGVRFLYNAWGREPAKTVFKRYGLLAAAGGFFDSFGGGGWGPIVTSTLLHKGRSHRFTVGTVSLTEFFVTLASALTFFQLIGLDHWKTILALVAGGSIAAPIAARLAGRLPKRTSYALLGALVVVWSLRIILKVL